MDGWIHSTLPSARTPKIRVYCLLLTRGSRGGSLARGRDGRSKLGGGRGGRSRVVVGAVLGMPRDGQTREDFFLQKMN